MDQNQSTRKRTLSLKLVIILVMAVLLVVFTLQNQEKVSLKLLFWTIRDIPVALLIVTCLLLGYLISFFSLLSRTWKQKSELRRARLENAKPEVEDQQEYDRGEESFKRKERDPEGIPFDEDENPQDQKGSGPDRFFRD